MVLDVRFLRNPHYDEVLKIKTGQDDEVGQYIMKDPVFEKSWEKISELVLTLLPQYQKEGKSYFTIAFGCTGGKHRSVFMAEKLARLLESKEFNVNLNHRELSR